MDTLKSVLTEYFVSHVERNYNKAMAIKNKERGVFMNSANQALDNIQKNSATTEYRRANQLP